MTKTTRFPCGPCCGETLDKLVQPAILAILAEGPAHGYRLAARIGKMPLLQGHKPDVSGIYRILKSMERRGLVSSSWRLGKAGPARRAYRITANGRKCLARWVETLRAYRRGLSALLRVAASAARRRAKAGA